MLKEEEKKILNWISGSNPDFRRIMQKIQVLFKKEDYTKKQFNMTLANRLIRADKSEWLLEIAHKYPQHSFSFESGHETRMDPVHVFLGQEKLNLVDALAKRKIASEDEYWESRWAIIESLLNDVNLFEHFENIGLDWKGALIDSAGPNPRVRNNGAIQSYF